MKGRRMGIRERERDETEYKNASSITSQWIYPRLASREYPARFVIKHFKRKTLYSFSSVGVANTTQLARLTSRKFIGERRHYARPPSSSLLSFRVSFMSRCQHDDDVPRFFTNRHQQMHFYRCSFVSRNSVELRGKIATARRQRRSNKVFHTSRET